jgi:hypothetical protein
VMDGKQQALYVETNDPEKNEQKSIAEWSQHIVVLESANLHDIHHKK